VQRVTALAEDEPRLAPHVADRLGVELCEGTVAAVKAGRVRELARLVPVLLVRRSGRMGILRRGARHFRERRAWFREGAELWSARRDLREWLGSY
jgi:hypothetical protein